MMRKLQWWVSSRSLPRSVSWQACRTVWPRQIKSKGPPQILALVPEGPNSLLRALGEPDQGRARLCCRAEKWSAKPDHDSLPLQFFRSYDGNSYVEDDCAEHSRQLDSDIKQKTQSLVETRTA